jgi:hypothetical protein
MARLAVGGGLRHAAVEIEEIDKIAGEYVVVNVLIGKNSKFRTAGR